jgi:hypothetical protein
MALTPQITLTATLLDYSGAQIGTAAQPAYLRIALCGFEQTLPRVANTGMIAKIASWPGDLAYTGAQLTVALWGNDVIVPSGKTYYAIAVLDASKNVLQSGIYQFNGTQTIDLSNAVQIVQPAGSPSPFYVPVPFSTTPVFIGTNNLLTTFEITLTGNVISSSITNLQIGQIVNFIIHQDATGSRTFVFPPAVVNGGSIKPNPNATSVQAFVFNGFNLYPIGPMTWQ